VSRHLPQRPFIQRVLVLRTPLVVWIQCWLGLLASLGRWTTAGGVQQGVVLDCRACVVPGILKKIERGLGGERVFKNGSSSPSGDAPRAHGQVHTVL
jgi:hypothetical protein